MHLNVHAFTAVEFAIFDRIDAEETVRVGGLAIDAETSTAIRSRNAFGMERGRHGAALIVDIAVWS
jgi:hypothetical protein